MNKAFVKETDDDKDIQAEIKVGEKKNYVTPFGLDALQQEYRQLLFAERPKIVEAVHWAAKNGDRSENGDYIYGKRRLREIDRRVRYLKKRIETASIVDPIAQKNLQKVFFGATVIYQQKDGSQHQIKIVGIDEADIEKGKISWTAPFAKALMKRAVGDKVQVKTPGGKQIVEIISIQYKVEP